MVEGLDHVQQALLLRVPVRLAVRQVMVQVVEVVAEARGEPQGVQDRVEEAGVAKVGKRRDSRAVGTPLVPVHTVHRPLLGLSGQGAKAIAPSCPSWLSDCLLDLVYFRASATTFALPHSVSSESGS